MSLQVTTFVNGKWRQNCYIVANEQKDAFVIDPGSQFDEMVALVDRNRWRLHAIINTHAHYDHVGAVTGLKERYRIPFYLHAADHFLLKHANLYRMLFESKEAIKIPDVTVDISALPGVFSVGPFELSWIAAPGHTEGSVCLVLENLLFSGDTLMHDALGRTDLPGANREQLFASVRKLMELPSETLVYAGHGPRTTIGAEFSPNARVRSLIQ